MWTGVTNRCGPRSRVAVDQVDAGPRSGADYLGLCHDGRRLDPLLDGRTCAHARTRARTHTCIACTAHIVHMHAPRMHTANIATPRIACTRLGAVLQRLRVQRTFHGC